MRPLRHMGERARVLQALYRANSASFVTSFASSVRRDRRVTASVRFLHTERDKLDVFAPGPTCHAVLEKPRSAKPEAEPESIAQLLHRIRDSKTTYSAALKAFNNLRSRSLKLDENLYLSLLYKASREGRFERVWTGYYEFLEDERKDQVKMKQKRSSTTWPSITTARMQMYRFVLWAMLDSNHAQEMVSFYQNEVVGKCNAAGIHEADSLNFLLRLECTTKVMDETDNGLRQRVETLLNAMEKLKLHTSYSSTHMLVRLILYRPEIFFDAPKDKEKTEDGAALNTKYIAKAMGKLIIDYMDRFPCALALDPKRLSIAVSAAAAAGQHDAAKMLLQYGAAHHVPIDEGSFAHAVESASDDAKRLEIADLYMHAKEHERIYSVQDTESSFVNYLLLYAIIDGNFKHMMELLHEMQLYNNKASNRTICELFNSIAQFRAEAQMRCTETGAADKKKLAECPTIMELFEKFPNAIPYTTYSLSQGILQSLRARDLTIALKLMRVAYWHEDVKLRPEIYSQLLYPLLAGGQRGGDESSDVSVFDRLEVERSFDRQYPNQRVHLNALVVNICQSNQDISTMLVCLDRWQGQGHPPMSRRVIQRVFDMISEQIQQLRKHNDETGPGAAFIVDGMQLSYEALLIRYRQIITWDAWTFERAIVRARTSGLHADVVALLAQATSSGLMLNSTAYIVSLYVLEEVGEPSAIVACAEKMKASNVWEKAVAKDPNVQRILDRALAARQ